MALSFFVVSADRFRTFIPRDPRLSLVKLGSRCLIGAAWVDYGPKATDCVLAYRELLVAVLARKGILPRVHILRIWVDSPESLSGGRKLWAIPKDLATFSNTANSWEARGRTGSLAKSTDIIGSGPKLPLPFFVPMTLIQKTVRGDWLETPSKIKGEIQLGGRWNWSVPPESELAALFEQGTRKPWLNLLLTNVRIHFGRE